VSLLKLTVIVLALLAGIGGLVMLAGLCLRAAVAHGARCPDVCPWCTLPGRIADAGPAARVAAPLTVCLRLSVAAGLTVIILTSVSLSKLIEDVTKRDGVAMLDHPVGQPWRCSLWRSASSSRLPGTRGCQSWFWL